MMTFWIAPNRTRRIISWFIFILVLAIALPASPGLAQSPIRVNRDQAKNQFPESITFHIDLESTAEINKVELEYRVEQVTCGEVISRAFPQFTTGTSITTEWNWEMRQSGSLPPGARIYWRWHVTDAAGNTLDTAEKYTTWLDNIHDWQSLKTQNINLHWYGNPETFAQELLEAATAALGNLEEAVGLTPEKPIDLYIYANNEDLRQAILYEPGWAGGQAFSEHDIVIIGIAPGQIDWGKGAVAHELTHVLIGHLTFSCLGYLPGWVQEGLAMYGEGGLDDFSKARFEQAIQEDELISVQALSGGFSENPDKADLSYSESYSLVNYLIETHGKEAMLAFLSALKEGETVEQALQQIYGFGIDGLEDAWRSAIGAQPRQAAAQAATATANPTPIPTIVPVSGIEAGAISTSTLAPDTPEPLAASLTPAPSETPSPQPTTAVPSATAYASPTPTPAKPTATSVKPELENTPTRPSDERQTSPPQSSNTSQILIYIGAAVLVLVLIVVAVLFTLKSRSRRMGPPTIQGGS